DSRFMIAAQVLVSGGSGSGTLTGRDLWSAAALASVEAAVRLTEGTAKSGVASPAEAFEAVGFLRDLAARGAFELRLPGPAGGARPWNRFSSPARPGAVRAAPADASPRPWCVRACRCAPSCTATTAARPS